MGRYFWRPWLGYGLLAFVIMGPLLAPGYILALDMNWGPRLPQVTSHDNGWLLHETLRMLSQVGPSWLVQKLVLLTIFTFMGVGAYRLAARRFAGWPAYTAGLLFVMNPFVYERFMAGQWLVLAGAAVLPWFVHALWNLLERPRIRFGLVLGAWAAILGIVSIHTLALAAVVGAISVAAHDWGRWRKLLRQALPLGLAIAVFVIVNAYWLLPVLLGRSDTARTIAGFDAGQFAAFATSSGPLGSVLNVLTLQGFWAADRELFLPASVAGPWFWFVTALVGTAVLVGAVIIVRRRDRFGVALLAAALLGWILAVGTSSPVTGAFTHWLVDWVPFYQGYREPHKWALLLVLFYAYAIAAAGSSIKARATGFWRYMLPAAIGLVIVAWTPLMLWGGAGQLRSTHYPVSWHKLDQKLSSLPSTSRPDTVIFPWHQYLYLDFAGRIVAHPAPNFFHRPVIVSGDPEILGLAEDQSDPLAKSIQNNVINRRFFEQNAGTRFRELGVDYIVLQKVSDWSNYDWLVHQSDLTLVAETSDWQLYSTRPSLP